MQAGTSSGSVLVAPCVALVWDPKRLTALTGVLPQPTMRHCAAPYGALALAVSRRETLYQNAGHISTMQGIPFIEKSNSFTTWSDHLDSLGR